MLRCRDVVERTGDYLGRALPWPARIGFRAHLLMCRNCRRFLAQLRQTAGLLGHAPPAAVPPGVEKALVEAFGEHVARRRYPHPD